VILAVHKYLALLRSTKFSRFHHEELVNLSAARFRFAEKKRPDNYATWISEHMAWPLPPEFLLAGPVLTLDWDNDADHAVGEAKIAEYLQQFRIRESRVALMAKKDEHLKINPNMTWDQEPWYGTEYSVQRFDETFIREVLFSSSNAFGYSYPLFGCRLREPMIFLNCFYRDPMYLSQPTLK
jgi:insulysin